MHIAWTSFLLALVVITVVPGPDFVLVTGNAVRGGFKTTPGVGTEAHAHADLVRALRHDIGDDAVETDRAEDECNGRRSDEREHREAHPHHRVRDDFVVRGRCGDRQVRIDRPHLRAREGREAGVFQRAETEMVEGIFDIGDRTAAELMTPRLTRGES